MGKKKHVRTSAEKALVRRLDLVLMVFGFASQGMYGGRLD